MLITHRCASCCWAALAQCEGPSCFSHCPHIYEAGMHKKLGQGTGQTVGQTNIPCHVTLHSEIKAGGTLRVAAFAFLGKSYLWWSPTFLEMAVHLPANVKQWMIHYPMTSKAVWNWKLPMEAVTAPRPAVFKKHWDSVPRCMVNSYFSLWRKVEFGAGLHNPYGSFPTHSILWFCESPILLC